MKDLFIFNHTEQILAGTTAGLFIIQLLYYLITYSRPLKESKKNIEKRNAQPTVSVIVYAKNESENLKKYLPSLLAQEYPEYEVIVINDGSTDESDEVLKMLKNDNKHLYHTYIPEDVKYLSRKKLALTVGIKAAQYDILLFTEANCEPVSKNWISAMARNYDKESSIVLGFCAYGNHKGLFHKLVAYDNLISGLQYISSALTHQPYVGNGRNLSYRKELFFAHKGYYKSLSLHAGDDDLFINESANKSNTRVEYSPESITEMAKIERFSMWKEMKVSRAATHRYYKGGRLTFYRMESMSYLLFLLTVIAAISTGLYGSWLLSLLAGLLYISLFAVKAVILHKSARLLQQKPVTSHLFILELMLPVFNLYVRIYRTFRGKNDYTFRLGNK